jgi:hypothetical protein
MNCLSPEVITSAFERASPPETVDYTVLRLDECTRSTHLAVSREGHASLIVPLDRVGSETIRLTHGVALRSFTLLEFGRACDRWRRPAAVIECRDPKLLKTFAAMLAAMVTRLQSSPQPSWDGVTSLFAEWERLLGRRRLLSGEAELGLWGELWCLARTVHPNELLDGWRGPEGECVDFLVGGFGLEVKAARRAGVHMISQSQVDHPLGDTPVGLLSMHLLPEPVRGKSLTELVRDVSGRAGDIAMLQEKLAGVGYSHDDASAYTIRYVLVEPPLLYDMRSIPRVHAVDPGVSHIRFQVELAREAAIDGPELDKALSPFGLEPMRYTYPCV